MCVATGDFVDFGYDEITMVPMRNPQTGDRTMLPCIERDGQMFVDSHYRRTLDRIKELNAYVDPETLAVRSD